MCLLPIIVDSIVAVLDTELNYENPYGSSINIVTLPYFKRSKREQLCYRCMD